MKNNMIKFVKKKIRKYNIKCNQNVENLPR